MPTIERQNGHKIHDRPKKIHHPRELDDEKKRGIRDVSLFERKKGDSTQNESKERAIKNNKKLFPKLQLPSLPIREPAKNREFNPCLLSEHHSCEGVSEFVD